MQMRRLRKSISILLLIFIAGSIGGCRRAGFRNPITKFQEASSVVIASTRVYLTELNKVERDNYIFSQAGKTAQIKLDEIENVQLFTPDGLKARLDTLELLANFGDLLSKLANSDAPERIRAQTVDLGKALETITGNVAALAGADAGFKAAFSPLAAIVGEIL